MNCPFCEQEMIAGIMSGDGRSRVRWESENKKLKWSDKLVGNGEVKGVEYSFWKIGQGAKFKLKTNYCPQCKKMLFDTDIS